MPASKLPPLGLYVHIPWCVRKCPYCDFNSHTAPTELPEQEYVSALAADLREDVSRAQGRRISSVFFGGGTPSLFSAAAIGQILEGVDSQIGLEADAEITLEANPGTVEQERFAGFRRAGVNRLSLGIQSLNSEHLGRLGRIHDRNDAVKAIATARAAGFDNMNLDLMHGLPDQDRESALDDIRQALAFEPEHLSWYQLTIEPNTVFYNQPPQLPEPERLAEIEEAGQEVLAAAGYEQYEISAYCKGPKSRHNCNYWEFGDYLGIGAGAHGKVTSGADSSVWRSRKTRLPAHYLGRNISADRWQQVPGDDLPLEFMMNALRLNAGVPPESFEARTGLPLSTVEAPLARLAQQGLVVDPQRRLATTELGRRFLNDVLAPFVP